MTVDLSELHRTIRRLQDDVAHLSEVAAAIEEVDAISSEGGPPEPGVELPSEIVVPDPKSVATYLRAHADLVPIVRDLAVALVEEFRSEPAEIELSVYQDPEIDDPHLVFDVRLSRYDESFVPRLRAASEPFDRRRSTTDGWVIVSTDFGTVE